MLSDLISKINSEHFMKKRYICCFYLWNKYFSLFISFFFQYKKIVGSIHYVLVGISHKRNRDIRIISTVSNSWEVEKHRRSFWRLKNWAFQKEEEICVVCFSIKLILLEWRFFFHDCCSRLCFYKLTRFPRITVGGFRGSQHRHGNYRNNNQNRGKFY